MKFVVVLRSGGERIDAAGEVTAGICLYFDVTCNHNGNGTLFLCGGREGWIVNRIFEVIRWR